MPVVAILDAGPVEVHLHEVVDSLRRLKKGVGC